MNKFLVALNIIDLSENNILNKDGVPILFYSTSPNIKDELIKNSSMVNWIKQNIINYKLYTYTKITYIYYKENEYQNSDIYIKDIINANELENMIYNDLLEIAKELYKYIMHTDEDFTDIGLEDILNVLSIKIKGNIEEATYINYFRYALRKKYEYMSLSDVEAYIAKLPNIYTT